MLKEADGRERKKWEGRKVEKGKGTSAIMT